MLPGVRTKGGENAEAAEEAARHQARHGCEDGVDRQPHRHAHAQTCAKRDSLTFPLHGSRPRIADPRAHGPDRPELAA